MPLLIELGSWQPTASCRKSDAGCLQCECVFCLEETARIRVAVFHRIGGCFMRKVAAVLGIIVTLVLAVIGFSGYSSGSYSMAFLDVELSRAGFLVLVLAFIAYDILPSKERLGRTKRWRQCGMLLRKKRGRRKNWRARPAQYRLRGFPAHWARRWACACSSTAWNRKC